MAKLTKAQLETLALIRDDKVTNENTGHGSWRTFGASPGVVGRLRSMGLATEAKLDDRNYRFELTDAGRAVLADASGDRADG